MISNDEYYLNIDCSKDDMTATIDANFKGWEIFKNKLLSWEENSYRNIYLTTIKKGGILTTYIGQNTQVSIENIVIEMKESQKYENNLYFHIEFNEKNKTIFFYMNLSAMDDLLKSIDSLLSHKGNYPADISYMSPDWGGDSLNDDKASENCTLIGHFRLFRWQ